MLKHPDVLFKTCEDKWKKSDKVDEHSVNLLFIDNVFNANLCNAHWDSIGTFRDSPTDLCIAGILLFIVGTVLNLVMGRGRTPITWIPQAVIIKILC